MKYLIAGVALLVPIVAAWRVLYGPEGAIRTPRAAASLALSDLLEARSREITARSRFRDALHLDADSPALLGVLRHAKDIVSAANRDLGRAAFLWRKIFASCNADYAIWHSLDDAIRRASEIDDAIERALEHGDPDETERMFDEAMDQKLTAIEQMKAYLSRRG
jgi:hypothetical protein